MVRPLVLALAQLTCSQENGAPLNDGMTPTLQVGPTAGSREG